MLTHITPRGISALPGPVGEPTLLAPVDEKKVMLPKTVGDVE